MTPTPTVFQYGAPACASNRLLLRKSTTHMQVRDLRRQVPTRTTARLNVSSISRLGCSIWMPARPVGRVCLPFGRRMRDTCSMRAHSRVCGSTVSSMRLCPLAIQPTRKIGIASFLHCTSVYCTCSASNIWWSRFATIILLLYALFMMVTVRDHHTGENKSGSRPPRYVRT